MQIDDDDQWQLMTIDANRWQFKHTHTKLWAIDLSSVSDINRLIVIDCHRFPSIVINCYRSSIDHAGNTEARLLLSPKFSLIEIKREFPKKFSRAC
jgi:hypothetical protein